uniref:Uncharacterized protein n=2 Tax=Eutreptiella gymnastica TaxID=73025 RepID=A0A7S1I7X9_9EUGL|mmetsp:Transcript_136668/g.237289  ORF Transcript_136668/g.237289 Transcript_136668/m.237289 type:complete len:960 (+) Transcript_136668:52-2931(+)
MRLSPEDTIHVPASLEPYLQAEGDSIAEAAQRQKKTKKGVAQQAAAVPEEPEEGEAAAAAADVDNDLVAITKRLTRPSDIYQARCSQVKVTADATVVRRLETDSLDELSTIDLDSVMFNGAEFHVLMEICQLCPKLLRLTVTNSNLKNEHLLQLVEMAQLHPSLCRMSVAGNRLIAFSCAPLLLGLVKKNPKIVELDTEETNLAMATRLVIENQVQLNKEALGEDGELSVEEMKRRMDEKQAKAKEEALKEASKPLPVRYIVEEQLFNEMQQTMNDRVKLNLVEHINRLVKLCGDTKAATKKSLESISFNTGQTAQVREAHRDMWQWAQPLEFRIKSLTQLQLKEEEIYIKYEGPDAIYTPGGFPTTVHVSHLVEEMLTAQTTRERRAELLKEMLVKVTRHGPGSPGAVKIIGEFAALIGEDETKMARVHEMLDTTEDQIVNMNETINDCDRNRKEAYQQEDWRSYEEWTNKSLDLQEKIMELITYRANRIGENSQDAFKKNVEVYVDQVHTGVCQAKNENENMKLRLNADKAHLAAVKEKQRADMKLREKQMDRVEEKMEEFLKRNQQRQAVVWETIQSQLEELEKLNVSKNQEIEKWSRKKEEYTRNQKQSELTIEGCTRHEAALEELVADLETCENILNSWEPLCQRAKKKAFAYIEDSAAEREEMTIAEIRRYVSVFRRYWMTIGDVVFKKEKRLEEINRQIRSTEFLVEFTKETLDPELHRYKETLGDLQINRDNVTKKLDEAMIRSEDQYTTYLPWEQKLRDLGEDVESPVVQQTEVQMENRTRLLKVRENHLNKDRNELVVKEKKELESHKEMVQSKSAPPMAALLPQSPTRFQLGSATSSRTWSPKPQSPSSPVSPRSPHFPAPPSSAKSGGRPSGSGIVFARESRHGPGVDAVTPRTRQGSLTSSPSPICSSVGPLSTRSVRSDFTTSSAHAARKAKVMALTADDDDMSD